MIVKYIPVFTDNVEDQSALFTITLGFRSEGEIEFWPGVKCKLFCIENTNLYFVVVPRRKANGAKGVIVLNTEDCLLAFNQLKNNGVKVVSRPYYLPAGLVAVLEDKTGNQLILLEERIYKEE